MVGWKEMWIKKERRVYNRAKAVVRQVEDVKRLKREGKMSSWLENMAVIDKITGTASRTSPFIRHSVTAQISPISTVRLFIAA